MDLRTSSTDPICSGRRDGQTIRDAALDAARRNDGLMREAARELARVLPAHLAALAVILWRPEPS